MITPKRTPETLPSSAEQAEATAISESAASTAVGQSLTPDPRHRHETGGQGACSPLREDGRAEPSKRRALHVEPPLLEIRRLSCRVPSGNLAVEDASLCVTEGSIHAILGENGAGKTTLMKAIFGLIEPSSGAILWEGRAIRLASAADALALGIGMVQQHVEILPTLTVWETILLGQEPRRWGRIDKKAALKKLDALMQKTGLFLDLEALAEDLSVGQKQRLEILKALSRDIRLLILDEPTAVLAPQEIDALFEILQDLRRQGLTILFISHKLREVKRLADSLTILRRGKVIVEGQASDFSVEAIAREMVGHPVVEIRRQEAAKTGEIQIEVKDLVVDDPQGRPALKGVSLEIREGEILGVAGVEGNGQRELLEAILGLRDPVSGAIRLGGQDISRLAIRQRFQRGIAHVPEDRQKTGVVMEQSLLDNLFLGQHRDPAFLRGGLWRDLSPMQSQAHRDIQRFGITPPELSLPLRSFSGGNQQKVVIAREVRRKAKVLLIAHPTRGVDIGAIAAIHQAILEERQRSAAILFVSSELSEILALSDRIIVLFEGKIAATLVPEGLDETTLGLAMLGVSKTMEVPPPRHRKGFETP